jgi:hypothetical protein
MSEYLKNSSERSDLAGAGVSTVVTWDATNV